MIIIEGADNTGKSTLGQKLSEMFLMELKHSIRPDPLWTPQEALEHSYRQLHPQLAILDRVYAISEYVYGPICRGRSALADLHDKALIDLQNRPYLIIYCRPSMGTILRNNGRDQMDGVIENHQEIVKAYDELMAEFYQFGNCQVMWYDWEAVGEDVKLRDRVRAHLKQYNSTIYSGTFMNIQNLAKTLVEKDHA